MKVAIVGGGNIGMCLLGEISRQGLFDVVMCASRPEEFASSIRVECVETEDSYEEGRYRVTDDLTAEVEDADVVLCTLPAFLRERFVSQIEEVVSPKARVGFFPAYGGAEYFCGRMLERGVTVFGLQKVPYIARTRQRGKIAGLLSKKKELLVGAMPSSESEVCAKLVETMLGIESHPLSNFLAAALLPGNPLLHTCGASLYLSDYVKGKFYDHPIRYWQEWTDEASNRLFAMSEEMRNVCDGLPLDLDSVKSIPEYYETPTPQAFTVKVHQIPSFQGILLPMKVEEGGYVPDFESRFFTEDFPYGVALLKGLSLIADVATPTIDLLLDWYRDKTGFDYISKDGEPGRDYSCVPFPQRFGLTTPSELLQFYR